MKKSLFQFKTIDLHFEYVTSTFAQIQGILNLKFENLKKIKSQEKRKNQQQPTELLQP